MIDFVRSDGVEAAKALIKKAPEREVVVVKVRVPVDARKWEEELALRNPAENGGRRYSMGQRVRAVVEGVVSTLSDDGAYAVVLVDRLTPLKIPQRGRAPEKSEREESEVAHG